MTEEVQESPPRSFPIQSLKELSDRSYFSSFHFFFNRSSVPLQGASTARANRPRLLVCHDYKGGYLDDQWIQGSNNASAYNLSRWRLVDIFVYFSHNLVTLPPPGWVNAAHRHGVQVLGTFITEWEKGVSVCRELLATKESARLYADRLAELAQALGFDGWLINIENAVPHLVNNLQEFVRHLTDSMHLLVPGSSVIWYDSVTKYGMLAWQNQLNDANKLFFDVCDGIFTNYSWKREYAKNSAIIAGGRACDVYMGVDVFGRNTFGGGGFQCDVALKAAQEAGVSAALFAPGWTFETNQDDRRWWNSIENCWLAARSDPVQPPFFTDFDIGFGSSIYIGGKQVSDSQWNNLSCQSLQPLLHLAPESEKHILVTSSQDSAAYSGGSSIKVVGEVDEDEVCVFQLYQSDVVIEKTSLHISYSVLAESSSNFCLALRVLDREGACSIHFLMEVEEVDTDSFVNQYDFKHMSAVFDLAKMEDDAQIGVSSGRNLQINESLKTESSLKSPRPWRLRKFILEVGPCTLTDVFGVCSTAKDLRPILIKLLHDNESIFYPHNFVEQNGIREQIGMTYHVRVGHLSISPAMHPSSPPTLYQKSVGVSWLKGVAGEEFVSLNLGWEVHKNASDLDYCVWERYHLYVKASTQRVGVVSDLHYLGMAMVEAFYVYMLPLPKQSSAVTFYLQAQSASGYILSLDHSSTYTLEVPSPESGSWSRLQSKSSDWLFKEGRVLE